jgi:glutamate synthase (NADPH/NADH) small chain
MQGRVTKLHGSKVELVRKDGQDVVENVPAPEFEMDVDWCCWRWVSSARSGGAARQFRRQADRTRQRVARFELDDQRARRVHGGDMQRGQSLIVWAIAEGRSAARGVDLFLMGSSDLPRRSFTLQAQQLKNT